MKNTGLLIASFSLGFLSASCQPGSTTGSPSPSGGDSLVLPEPYATKSRVNFSRVIGWPEEKTPVAPPGFTVSLYASDLVSPRWMYVTPNGDVLVALANTEKKGLERFAADFTGASEAQRLGKSVNQIILLRDEDKDGVPERKELFHQGLDRPFGMLILNGYFYVAATDGIWRYPYQPGQTKINGEGEKIATLPAGGYNNHWTRNIIASPDGSKIYVSVGSGSNVAENGIEHEARRACILEMNPDGSGERIYAGGLRNPVGMDWAPKTTVLWTAVNERDGLGDELVPDYMTGVKQGAFYGWPYAYFGRHEDPRRKGERPDLVQKTIVPDVPLGSHTASLGLAFYKARAFPSYYHDGAFIGQHGSWNHSRLVGYRVAFVPFKNGKPAGPPEDFLTGFIANAEKSEVYGRPVGVTILPDGSMLVTDDGANVIWRITADKKQ